MPKQLPQQEPPIPAKEKKTCRTGMPTGSIMRRPDEPLLRNGQILMPPTSTVLNMHLAASVSA